MPDDILGLQRDIGKIWGAVQKLDGDHRELKTTVIGQDGTNGLRSRVAALEDRTQAIEDEEVEMEARLQHYYDIERQETCHGLRALEKHEMQREGQRKKEVELEIAEMGNRAKVQAQIWMVLGVVLAAGLNLAANYIMRMPK